MGKYKVVENVAVKPFCVPESEIYRNGKFKYYPTSDGGYQLGSLAVFRNQRGFRIQGYENSVKRKWVSEVKHIPDSSLDTVSFNPKTGQDVVKKGMAAVHDTPHGLPVKRNITGGNKKGRYRAKVKVFDYIRSNCDLDCMFTMTFSNEVIDRTSYDDIIKNVGQWLSNRVRRKGLKYIAVAEFHSDGEAIHFHGVCNFAALETKFSGHKQKGKMVYNITDFPFGFTAVKKIGDTEQDRYAVAVYVSKYITKGGEKVGGRYFLHGGDLKKPREVICEVRDETVSDMLQSLPCKEFTTPTPCGGIYSLYTVQASEEFTDLGKSKKELKK